MERTRVARLWSIVTRRHLAAGVAVLALLGGCGGGRGPGAAAVPPVTLDVTMREVTFEPAAFTVPRGARVLIRYQNPSDFVHNLVVQSAESEGREFSSAGFVRPGERGTVEAVFMHPGPVKFVCTFHVGMDGAITVR